MEQIKPVDGVPVYKPSSNSSEEVIEKAVVKNVAPQFVSVKGNMDPKTGVFVTEVRDGGDGKVSFQYPSKKAAAAYSRPSSEESMESGASSKSSVATQEEKQSAAPMSATTENKQPVETSASADAVTDGTKSDT
jgi:hypothetical protein